MTRAADVERAIEASDARMLRVEFPDAHDPAAAFRYARVRLAYVTRRGKPPMPPVETVEKWHVRGGRTRSLGVLDADGAWGRGPVFAGYGQGEKIQGVYDPAVPCNATCVMARGHSCNCSCGGKHHGAGMAQELVVEARGKLNGMDRIALRRLGFTLTDDPAK